jgi:hypothetical protein
MSSTLPPKRRERTTHPAFSARRRLTPQYSERVEGARCGEGVVDEASFVTRRDRDFELSFSATCLCSLPRALPLDFVYDATYDSLSAS